MYGYYKIYTCGSRYRKMLGTFITQNYYIIIIILLYYLNALSTNITVEMYIQKCLFEKKI